MLKGNKHIHDQNGLLVLKPLKQMKISKTVSICLLCMSSCYADAQNVDIDLARKINPANPASDYWRFTSASTYFVSAAIPVGLLCAGLAKNDGLLKRKSLEVFEAISI